MALTMTAVSAIAAYIFLTAPCEIAFCGGGTLTLGILAFIAAMVCMTVAGASQERVAQEQRTSLIDSKQN
jgi:hypothetical protein